jgi:hypothetical protein
MVIIVSFLRLLIKEAAAKMPGKRAARGDVGIRSKATARHARLMNKCMFFDSFTTKLALLLNFAADIF